MNEIEIRLRIAEAVAKSGAAGADARHTAEQLFSFVMAHPETKLTPGSIHWAPDAYKSSARYNPLED